MRKPAAPPPLPQAREMLPVLQKGIADGWRQGGDHVPNAAMHMGSANGGGFMPAYSLVVLDDNEAMAELQG